MSYIVSTLFAKEVRFDTLHLYLDPLLNRTNKWLRSRTSRCVYSNSVIIKTISG